MHVQFLAYLTKFSVILFKNFSNISKKSKLNLLQNHLLIYYGYIKIQCLTSMANPHVNFYDIACRNNVFTMMFTLENNVEFLLKKTCASVAEQNKFGLGMN